MPKLMSLTRETNSQTKNSEQNNGFPAAPLAATLVAILAESLAEIPASRFHVANQVLNKAAVTLQNDHCLGNLG